MKKRRNMITDRATPAPWANYLGSPAYGAIISNNAGGYSFVKSSANGRILRYAYLMPRISQADIYICVITTPVITGRHHGSLSARALMYICANAMSWYCLY